MKKLSTLLLISYLIFSQNIPCLAWTVSPARFQIKAERGKEYTLTFSVLNESQLNQKRFEVQADDWTIDKKNNFSRKLFNKEIDYKFSATNWMKVSPQQFVVTPGETKNVRFTINVPEDIPIDGEYTTGIFVGEKNIDKPIKGEKVVHIKQNTFIGVIVYVRLGEDKPQVTLKDLKIETKSEAKGLNKVIILPTYESKGNVHSRAEISVKLESISSPLETKEFTAGELVVLRESEVTFPIEVPAPLAVNSEWKFVVNADFAKDTPVLVGTKKYKIPEIAKSK